MISNRISTIEESPIRKIFDIAAQNKDKNLINLSIGLPDFDAPDELKKNAINAINNGLNRYTPSQGMPELREKISSKLNKENNIKCNPDNIIVTTGTSGALFLAFNALLDPGDEIIMPDPYFVLYKQLARFIGSKPVFLDSHPDFKLDVDELNNVITKKTKAILLNTPNNPTGVVYSANELKQIAKLAEENNITIISDEVYEKFVYDEEHVSIGKYYNNTFTLNGFSKSHAITGWRLGYLCAPSEYIDPMVKLQQYSFVCAPSFAQKAVADSFNVDLTPKINEYRKKRDMIYNGLKDKFNVTKPGGAFYIYPEAPNKDGTKFVDKCIKNKLLVVPGSAFSEKNTHFRISFAAKDKDIEKGIDILNNI
jgi:aspartate aminotransferase/aminotransferase